MRTAKFLSVLICAILISAVFTPVLASDSPGYKVVIPTRFDGDAFPFQGDLATVQNGGKYGLIDKTGNVVVNFVYDMIYCSEPFASQGVPSTYCITIQNKKWGVIEKSGKPLIPCIYDSIRITRSGLAIIGKGKTIRPGPGSIDGVWGVIDLLTGREILPVKYRYISSPPDSLNLIVFLGNKGGVTDKSGQFVIPLKYDTITPSDDWQLFIVSQGNKVGLLDRTGKIVVPLGSYDYISQFKSGFASVQKKGRTGVIDGTGRIVVPVVYDGIDQFCSGLALAVKGNKFGVLNTSGKQVIPFQYDYGFYSQNGVFYLKQKGKTTIFDDSGKVIAPSGKYNVYDASGQMDKLIFVERGGKIGAIDMTGKLVVPLIYTEVREIKDDLIIFKVNDKSVVINRSGRIIMPLEKYGLVNLRDNGFIIEGSAEEGIYGLRDQNGKTILPCEYWGISDVIDNYVVANNEKGYAVFDKDGEIIVPFGEFDTIGRINENMVDVRKNGLTGYINLPKYVEKPDAWAQPEVDSAIAAGLVPENMRKNYQDNITRADFCRLAINLIEIKRMKIDIFMTTRGMSGRVLPPISFTDTNDPHVLAASRLGIVHGVGNNKFDPNGKITRQDAAVMLQLTAKVLDFTEPNGTSVSFADSSKFASYAVNAIDFVSTATDKESGNKIMGGTGNNYFSPLSPYTRQQAYITILRLFNAIN